MNLIALLSERIELIWAGILSLLPFVSWTKVILGAVLVYGAAFCLQYLPRGAQGDEGPAHAFGKWSLKFKNGISSVAAVAGVIFLVWAISEAKVRKFEETLDERYPRDEIVIQSPDKPIEDTNNPYESTFILTNGEVLLETERHRETNNPVNTR